MSPKSHGLRELRIETPRGCLGALEVHPPQGVPVRAHAIMVGGFLFGKEMWIPAMLRLARHGYRTCAYDHLGMPDSAGPDDPAAYTLELLAGDLVEAARQWASGEQVHVLASCFGGFVARVAVLVDPDLARSLVLLSSGSTLDESITPDLADYVASTLSTQGRQGLVDCVVNLLAREPEHPPKLGRAFEVVRRNLFESQLHHLIGFARAVATADFPATELRAVDIPKLVAYGAEDGVWTPAVQEAMAQRMGAVTVPITGAKHSPLLERPTNASAVLKDFLHTVDEQATEDHRVVRT